MSRRAVIDGFRSMPIGRCRLKISGAAIGHIVRIAATSNLGHVTEFTPGIVRDRDARQPQKPAFSLVFSSSVGELSSDITRSQSSVLRLELDRLFFFFTLSVSVHLMMYLFLGQFSTWTKRFRKKVLFLSSARWSSSKATRSTCAVSGFGHDDGRRRHIADTVTIVVTRTIVIGSCLATVRILQRRTFPAE